MLRRKINRTAMVFAMCCLLFTGACSGGGQSEMSGVYSQFARAIEGQRGYQATKLISKETEAHYSLLRDIALYGPRYRTHLTLYDEIGIYFLRSRYDKRQLLKFTGRDIFAVLVENGLIGVPDMDDFRLGSVSMTNHAASATLITNDPGANYRIGFTLENGHWRIDEAALRTTRDEVLAFRMVSYRGSREDVIDEILKSVGVREGLAPRLTTPISKS
jgi:hypothetical protein